MPPLSPSSLRLVTAWPIDPQLNLALRTQLEPAISLSFSTSGAFAVATIPGTARQVIEDICSAAFVRGVTLGFSPIARVKAVFFDMDATVIAEESLVELAAYAGQSEAVGRITERAMAGEIDFKTSLKERVALIKGLSVEAMDKVQAKLTLNPGIHEFIAACQSLNIKTFMASGGFTTFAAHVAGAIGITAIKANILEVQGGQLTGRVLGDIVDAQGKKDFLLEQCRAYGISPKEVAAVGDGANDIPMLHSAGVAVGYKPKKILLDHIHALNTLGDHRFLIPLLLGDLSGA